MAKPQTGPPTTARVVLSSAASFGLLAAVLFGCAGRLDWGLGWLYLALATANIAVTYFYLYRCNPELIRYRMQVGKGTKTWDKVWMAAFTPPFLAIYAVAALDAGRYAWSAVPLWLWPVGAALFLAGNALLSWSMGVNPFFEKTVRIQSERGHRVIDTGPYRLARHPGYLGFAGWIVSAPLLLGSWWAFAPAALALAGLVVRTALEDRTLRRELTGYVDYAGRVRFRLIPGVW